MFIEQLTVEAVRNLASQTLDFAAGVNLIYGQNGSGKTSVLEAIHLLGVGRSFRTALTRNLIRHEAPFCLAQAWLSEANNRQSIGTRRYRSGDVDLRLNGETVRSLSPLADALPLVLLNPDVSDLITGSPDQRRRFLDGTLFHVEQGFLPLWRRYHRALRQRNAGLRRGTMTGDEAWLSEMVQAGSALADLREKQAGRLRAAFREMAGRLSKDISALDLSLRQGWRAEDALADALAQSRQSDLERGFTQVGPHRCDLRLSLEGRTAGELLSRGQTKLAALALKLAQGSIIATSADRSPVFLVDDIVAELDVRHAGATFELLAERECQVILAAVDRDPIDALWPGPAPKVFHVEQGRLQQVG